MSTPEPATFYERLELSPDATQAEITAAYRRLALALHPDSAADHADPRALDEVVFAYRVLSDPRRRRDYDQRIGAATAPRRRSVCPVCRGTGRIRAPCPMCAGNGYQLMPAPWVQHIRICRRCLGAKTEEIRCGACGTTGTQ